MKRRHWETVFGMTLGELLRFFSLTPQFCSLKQNNGKREQQLKDRSLIVVAQPATSPLPSELCVCLLLCFTISAPTPWTCEPRGHVLFPRTNPTCHTTPFRATHYGILTARVCRPANIRVGRSTHFPLRRTTTTKRTSPQQLSPRSRATQSATPASCPPLMTSGYCRISVRCAACEGLV